MANLVISVNGTLAESIGWQSLETRFTSQLLVRQEHESSLQLYFSTEKPFLI